MLTRLKNTDRKIRRRLLLLMMAGVLLTTVIFTLTLTMLYRLALHEETEQLAGMLYLQGSLVDAMGRFDAQYSDNEEGIEGGAFGASMLQLQDALADQGSLGRTGEVLAAHRENGAVRYYAARHRNPSAINNISEVVQLALAGNSGVWHGEDYRGNRVVAAYTWVPSLDTALIAKRDVSELRQPFVRWGSGAALLMLLLLAIAVVVYRRSTRPIIEELQHRESFYSGLFINGPDAMILLDDKARVIDCNASAENLLGFDRPSLISKSPMLFSADTQADGKNTAVAIRETLKRAVNREMQRFDWRFKRSDNNEFDGEVASAIIKYGAETWFVALVRDLSNRQKMQRELDEAQERIAEQRDELAHADRAYLLGEMATGIAHEINQPLAAIQNYVSATLRRLGSDQPDIPRVVETLIKLEKQSVRAGDVISRMRNFARKEPVVPTRVSVAKVVTDSLQLAAVDFERQNVTADVAPLPVNAYLFVDEVQIQQVLLNLLRNAMESQAAAGKQLLPIKVTAVKRETRLEIVVIDRGTGLPTDDSESVFVPFFTTKKEGMGMGLAVSRSIIEAHGGELSATPNPSGGAMFKVSLPLDAYVDAGSGR